MNKFRIAKAGIDVNQGLQRLCGDVDLYEELLLKFLDDTHYEGMMKAIDAADVKLAFQEAHALKGIAGNMSLKKLYEAVVPVVEELRVDNIEVTDMLPEVVEAYDKAVEAISSLKK